MKVLNQEYQKAWEHFKKHRCCGAAPFRDYHKLIKIVQDYEFGTVLDILRFFLGVLIPKL